MVDDSIIKDFNKILALANPKVIANAKKITPKELGQNYVLHVGVKKTTEFVPHFSRISALSEDNTIPRIHTSPHLAGCLFAMQGLESRIVKEFCPTTEPKTNSLGKQAYLGGWYIHKIPFDVALKPNAKLVFDADISDEVWLITFNEQTKIYPATISGKVIPNFIKITPRVGKESMWVSSLLVEITDKDGVNLNKDTFLSEGYWELQFELDSKLINKKEMWYLKQCVVVKSDKKTFDENHKLKAALLSYAELPAFSNW